MIIGTLNFAKKTDTYTGEINTLTIPRCHAEFRPLKKGSEKEPDYRVVIALDSGSLECGAAWKRESEKGGEFLSVVIDDPSLQAPINAALFSSDDTNGHNLVWNRAKAKDKSSR